MRSTYRPVNATVASADTSTFPDVSAEIWVLCVPTVDASPDTCPADVAASDAACVAEACAVWAAVCAAAADDDADCAVDNAVDAFDAARPCWACSAAISVSA